MIPHLCPFELEIKMAEREGNSDSQELEDFISAQKWKNISFAGKCTHAKPSESGPFYPVHFRIMLHGICEKPSKLSSVV